MSFTAEDATMLSVYACSSSVAEGRVKKYFDYLIRDKAKLAVKWAGIVYKNGNIAEKTNKFNMSKADVQVNISN